MKCRVCHNGELTELVNLGHHPPSDAFLSKEDLDRKETHYPLCVYYCSRCGLAQLGYIVSPGILYQDHYPYTTGTNKDGVKHFTELADRVCNEFKLNPKDKVLDIGCNDGTLLKAFKDLGCDVYGVEPSEDIAEIAKNNGISNVLNDFWCYDTVFNEFFDRTDTFKVITATNVFAHVDDVHDFVEGVYLLMPISGVFIIECPNFFSLLENLEYDTIYHEHLSYFCERPMGILMKEHNLYIYKMEQYPIHGGTTRYYVKRLC